VNVVLSGPIWSRIWTGPGGLLDQLVANYGVDKEEAVKRFLEELNLPMGIGLPEDVAQAVVFLASPLAKFITGSSLDIGGTLLGLI
jgi:NAD(P)-dependent dehydrogenase (short-subunit alcohol dehydrogenase family)